MNGQYSKNNFLGQLAIVLHAHLPYVRKNEKNSLEEDWLFQAILEWLYTSTSINRIFQK